MISFACPACSQRYSVPDDKAGVATKCKKCGTTVTVPLQELFIEWLEEAGGGGRAADAAAPEAVPDVTGVAERKQPVCPGCGGSEFAFRPIFGPVGLREQRELELEPAAYALEGALRRIQEESARRAAEIDTWAAARRKAVAAEGGSTEKLDRLVEQDHEEVRASAAREEAAERAAFGAARERVRKRHPYLSGNRLNLVYCAGCGYVVTAAVAPGNLEERLVDVCRAVSFLHDTVSKFTEWYSTMVQTDRQVANVRSAVQAVGEMLDQSD